MNFPERTEVVITIARQTVRALVILASENGRSLGLDLERDIVLPWPRHPVAMDALMVFREDDGSYVELLTRTPVDITLAPETTP